ncbi:zinc finger protein 37-like [Cheilinus undulatus]|uniref:zinc finger protein 37-like n=1 Tax=Cheilinus undulatus TaxID=241271 RepID=UPI001BD4C296|nr:zinc finger protein 37-like [Cheilinus undulatus]
MCKMSGFQDLKDLSKRRLTELSGQTTTCEHEEELHRQGKHLGVILTSEMKLQRAVFPVEVQQLSVSKEEVLPEKQERSFSLNQEITIKEEPEELWSSQEGDQLQGPEEDEIIEFTFIPVHMESEEDEENPQSSRTHHRQTEHMETGADEDGYRGAEGVRYFDPESNLHPEIEVKTEDSSEAETDDSADWRETTEDQADLNSVENIKKMGRKTDKRKKTYTCSECGRIFNFKSYLTYHMRTHTGDEPFSCSECGKRFNKKHRLTDHVRIHTGEKPFSCTECDKKFSLKENLTRHMRTHTAEKPFSCSECGKRFTHQRCMKQHMKTHSGEKPFSCSVCGKSFSIKCYLSQHMKIHTGKKPNS